MTAFSNYVTVILITALVCALGENLAHGSQKKTVKCVLALAVLLAVVTPIPSLVKEVGEELSHISADLGGEITDGTAFSLVAEDAFSEGISLSLCEKFSLSKEDVTVKSSGFNPEKMTAETITVTLSGEGRLCDLMAVRDFVLENFSGRCRVESGN